MKMKKTAALLASLLLLAACVTQGGGEEISKERAIELARQHLTFEARSVEAEKVTDQGRPVWRVTFRGESPSRDRMGEFLTVNIDRQTGEMVSLGMS